MGDMIFEKTEVEILQEQLSVLKCENERIKKTKCFSTAGFEAGYRGA